MKNKLILHPKDYFISACGLKFENVGDMVIELVPPNIIIYPENEPEIKSIKKYKHSI